jgi:hypothetical protein
VFWLAIVDYFQGVTTDQFNSNARWVIGKMVQSVSFGQADEENMADLHDSQKEKLLNETFLGLIRSNTNSEISRKP